MNALTQLTAIYEEHLQLNIAIFPIAKIVSHPLPFDDEACCDVIKLITVPTLFSSNVTDGVPFYYIVSPVLYMNQEAHTILIGPFTMGEQTMTAYAAITEEQLEAALETATSLYEISKAYIEQETSSLVSTMLRMFQQIENQPDTRMEKIRDLLAQQQELDFIGVISKHNEHRYLVDFAYGEAVAHLQYMQVYSGEGDIGKTLLTQQPFYREYGNDTVQREFLHRYQVKPKTLFATPLNIVGLKDAVLFGGNFSGLSVSQQSRMLMLHVTRYLYQKREQEAYKTQQYHVKSYMLAWRDASEAMQSKRMSIEDFYKMLHYYEHLYGCLFVCFTHEEGTFAWRGELSDIHRHVHHEARESVQQFGNGTIKQQHCYIHIPFKQIGLFTLYFDDAEHATLALDVLKGMYVQASEPTIQASLEIFEVLRMTASTLNQKQVYVIEHAERFIAAIDEQVTFTVAERQLLQNIVALLPYDWRDVEPYINEREEWDYLCRAYSVKKSQQTPKDMMTALILFLCQAVKEADITSDLLLPIQYRDMFRNTYTDMMKEYEGEQSLHVSIQDTLKMQRVLQSLHFTSREQGILTLLMDGLTNQEVAHHLKISVHTVKNHMTNIFKKMNVSDRMQAVAKIYRLQLEDD